MAPGDAAIFVLRLIRVKQFAESELFLASGNMRNKCDKQTEIISASIRSDMAANKYGIRTKTIQTNPPRT